MLNSVNFYHKPLQKLKNRHGKTLIKFPSYTGITRALLVLTRYQIYVFSQPAAALCAFIHYSSFTEHHFAFQAAGVEDLEVEGVEAHLVMEEGKKILRCYLFLTFKLATLKCSCILSSKH